MVDVIKFLSVGYAIPLKIGNKLNCQLNANINVGIDAKALLILKLFGIHHENSLFVYSILK